MSGRARRTRGCERPFTAEQVVATGGQLAFTAATYTLFGVYVQAPEIAIPVVIYTIPVVSLLAMWAYCIIVDPALPVRCASIAVTLSSDFQIEHFVGRVSYSSHEIHTR
jgi:hypothetical protein